MASNNICLVCGEDYSRVALVDLVYTFIPKNDELVQIAWHKNCYLSANNQRPNKAIQAELLPIGGNEASKPTT